MEASDRALSEGIAQQTQNSALQGQIRDLEAADRRAQTTVAAQQQEIIDSWVAHHQLRGQLIQTLTALKACQA